MRRFGLIVGLLLTLVTVGTVGIHFLTDRPWLQSAYLAVITLTTVGSEDVPHDDPAAMLFIMGYLVCGISVFTYSAFQIGGIVVNAEIRGMLEKRRMEQQIQQLSGHYVVCGMGRMGVAICEHLHARQRKFVVVDSDADRLAELARPRGWLHVHGDATDDNVLIAARLAHAAALATVLPTDADNVYVVLSARMQSAKLQIIARSSTDDAMKKLQRAGATRVVSPFSTGAVKMARFMLNPGVEDFLEIADRHGSPLELADVQVTAGHPLIGKSLDKTDLRQKGVIVIGIRRENGERLLPPPPTAVIQPGDSLFVFGSSGAVNGMIEG
ncbi:MAG: potassium channel protein [Planctomycetaceae bacterium]|nr:potassium channel protein [Planctomycetaceae bacterium]